MILPKHIYVALKFNFTSWGREAFRFVLAKVKSACRFLYQLPMASTCNTTYSIAQKDSLQVINKSNGFAVSAFHICCCSPEKQPRRRRLAQCSGQGVRSNSFLSLHIFPFELSRLIRYEFLIFFLGRTVAAINEPCTKPVCSFIFHFSASLRSCDLFLQAA